jgi:hypothetical protein
MASGSAHEGEQRTPEGMVGELPRSFVLLEGLLPICGREFENTGSGPIGQQVEQISQICPRLDAMQSAMSETNTVLAIAPTSEPTKIQVFRPIASWRRFLSDMLFDIGNRPSSRKRSSAFC